MITLGGLNIFSERLGIPDGIDALLLIGMLLLCVLIMRYIKMVKREREEQDQKSSPTPQAMSDRNRVARRRVLQVWAVGVGSSFVIPIWLPYTMPKSHFPFWLWCLIAITTAIMISVIVLLTQRKLIFHKIDD